eukprot:Skav227599  [mRNA]  locus=scaffold1141:278674:279822:- [translate_table: standard]
MKWSLKEALVLWGSVLPATSIPWWRVRFHQGKYFYVHASGWWDELPEWEQESLEQAFYWEPEMAVYIHGHSQTCQFHESPPLWNQDAREWQVCRPKPDPEAFVAQELDLEEMWRYGSRGYGSGQRRMKKRFLERGGKEVPEELKPVKAEMAADLKKQMKKLWNKARQVEAAVDESQLPDLEESEETKKTSAAGADNQSDSLDSSSSCSEPGKAERRGGTRPTLGRSLSRGKTSPRITLAPVPEEPEKEEKSEKPEKVKGNTEKPCPSKESAKTIKNERRGKKKTMEEPPPEEEEGEDEDEEMEKKPGKEKEKKRKRRHHSRRGGPRKKSRDKDRGDKDKRDPPGGGVMEVDWGH